MSNSQSTALYFHWPFCKSKCPYCDFNVHVRNNIDHAAWRAAYIRAVEYYADRFPDRRIASVFFGGGTPSLMEPQTVQTILDAIQKQWPTSGDIEITLEANPTSVELKKFYDFRAAGVNRLSLGVQSLQDDALKFLGRTHDAASARAAIDKARRVFDRFSFDLMYARPNQTQDDWAEELRAAIALSGGHLSLYQLTIERSTPFFFDHAQGKFTMPAEDSAAEFYNVTQDILEEAGLPAYEISNHAAPGHESRHNLAYWRYGDYIGIGPGAHGRVTINGIKHATRDHSAPDVWLKRVTESGHSHHAFDALSPRDRFFEALMMGLRLRGGVARAFLKEQYGGDLNDVIDDTRVTKLQTENILVSSGNHLCLTREGRLRLNAVVPYIARHK